jgi:serine/threonine protein kinase
MRPFVSKLSTLALPIFLWSVGAPPAATAGPSMTCPQTMHALGDTLDEGSTYIPARAASRPVFDDGLDSAPTIRSPLAPPVAEPATSRQPRLARLQAKYGLVLTDGELPAKPFASGSDGNVYIGEKDGKLWAIKFRHASVLPQRFRSEADLARRASRGGVPGILDLHYDAVDDVHVMPFVPATLKDVIAEFRVVDAASADKALNLLQRLGESVRGMHANGVVHRDIKTQNILVDPSALRSERGPVTPYLGDFSLAAPAGGYVPGLPEDAVSGTPSHMSRAQLTPLRPAEFANDGHALGVVAWEVLSGQTLSEPRSHSSVERGSSGGFRDVPRPAKSLAAIEGLPEGLSAVSALGVFRPRDAQEFLDTIALARPVVDAQRALERAEQSMATSPTERNRELVRQARETVRRRVDAFFRSDVVRRQLDFLVDEHPELLASAPELTPWLDTAQRRRSEVR